MNPYKRISAQLATKAVFVQRKFKLAPYGLRFVSIDNSVPNQPVVTFRIPGADRGQFPSMIQVMADGQAVGSPVAWDGTTEIELDLNSLTAGLHSVSLRAINDYGQTDGQAFDYTAT